MGDLADSLLTGWASSSSSDEAHLLRHAYAAAGIVDPAHVDRDFRRRAGMDRPDVTEDDEADYRRMLRAPARAAKPGGRYPGLTDVHLAEAAQSLHRRAQAAHQEPTVVAYRGVHGEQARQLLAAAARGEPVHVRTDSISSWSTDRRVAERIARHGDHGAQTHAHAAVIEIRVPRAHVVASHRAGHVAMREKAEAEVIIANTRGYFDVAPERVYNVSR